MSAKGIRRSWYIIEVDASGIFSLKDVKVTISANHYIRVVINFKNRSIEHGPLDPKDMLHDDRATSKGVFELKLQQLALKDKGFCVGNVDVHKIRKHLGVQDGVVTLKLPRVVAETTS